MIYLIANYKVEGTTKASISDLRKWLLKNKIRALDSETPMSDWIEERIPISYQFGDKYDQWVIDRRDIDISSLKTLLEQEKGTLNIAHNVQFDYQVLKYHDNISLNSVWDTMLGEQARYNGYDKPKGFYSLEETHYRYFNNNPYSNRLSLFDPFITKKTRVEISKKPIGEQFTLGDIFYMAMDIVTAYKVYEEQVKYLTAHELLASVKNKNEFALVLGDCTLNGMPIDSEEWLRLAEYAESKRKEQLDILSRLYPSVTNWGSHVQVKKLFKELGIPIKYQDKESVSELVIKEYASQYPIIDEYLKYKKFQKLSTTYGVKFLERVNPHTGRIHSNFLQLPVTGRISSTSPNLQNLPQAKEGFLEAKKWREAFRTNATFTIADYSQQELRLAADISQDPNLISIFKENRDPHKESATIIYGVPQSEVTSEKRKNAKIFNFSIIYGTGAFKLSKTFNSTPKEAQKWIDNYYTAYPYLKTLQEETFKKAMETGYIITDSIGSKAYIQEYEYVQALEKLRLIDPDYNKEYKKLVGEIFRTCCNYIIQSQAALIAKKAGILLRNYLKTHPNEFKILLLEHDCWIIENFHPNAAEVLSHCMKEAVEQYCSIEIPAETLVINKWSK